MLETKTVTNGPIALYGCFKDFPAVNRAVLISMIVIAAASGLAEGMWFCGLDARRDRAF
jgi:hypothetical protein